MSRSYRFSANTANPKVHNEAIVGLPVLERLAEKLSQKTGVAWNAKNFQSYYHLIDTYKNSSGDQKKVEFVFEAKDFPKKLLNEDGTITFEQKIISESYFEIMKEKGVEFQKGYQTAHFNKGRVLSQEGVDQPEFKAYGIEPASDSTPFLSLSERRKVKEMGLAAPSPSVTKDYPPSPGM